MTRLQRNPFLFYARENAQKQDVGTALRPRKFLDQTRPDETCDRSKRNVAG